jgi:hypothetical protein
MSEQWSIDQYRQYLKTTGLLNDATVLPRETGPKSANKKVRNARRSIVDGISFDSELEKYCYHSLSNNLIAFTFKPKYVLQEAFTYLDEMVEEIAMYPDFYLVHQHLLVDTKGFKTQEFLLKVKFLKKNLVLQQEPPPILLPRTVQEVDSLIYKLRHQLPL